MQSMDVIGDHYWKLYNYRSSKGYVSQTIDNVAVNYGGWKKVNVALEPLPSYRVRGSVKMNNQAVNSTIVISDIIPDTLFCENVSLIFI